MNGHVLNWDIDKTTLVLAPLLAPYFEGDIDGFG
jgi:hypothetical protein